MSRELQSELVKSYNQNESRVTIRMSQGLHSDQTETRDLESKSDLEAHFGLDLAHCGVVSSVMRVVSSAMRHTSG